MANSINWGQGASTNSIGWGQGSINNSINWGKAQILNTVSGDTDLIGKNYILATAFQTRVTNDSGTFEALNCLISTLNRI